jgi:histidine ammonia-lyase
MSTLAALKCRMILLNLQSVVAIELLTAWQGVHFRRPLVCGAATEALWEAMRAEGMTPVLTDRVLYVDIEWTRRFLLDGKVWRIARAEQPAVID